MKLRTLLSVFCLSLNSLCAAQFVPDYAPPCDSSTAPAGKTAEVLNDTQGVDFGPYLRDDVLPKSKKNWYSVIPADAMPPLSKHGCVVIGFKIMTDGSLAGMRLLAGSGDVVLDKAAFDGVSSSAPFSPLAKEFKGPSIDLRFTFFYNPPIDTIQRNESSADSNPFLMYAKAQETASPAVQQVPASKIGGEENIQLGTPVHAVDPVVPKSLYGKDAAAVVGATIQIDGSFTDLWALGGVQDFEDAALDALHQWRYTPATLNGNPVAAKVFIIFVLKHGEITNSMEPDFPLPDGPKRDMRELYSKGELFAVDIQHVKPPKAIYSPDPEYSLAARVVKRKGTVLLGVILGRSGFPEDVWVIRKFVYSNGEQKTFKALGLGLEQKAIAAVRSWKFQPATKDGEPVPVFLNIEVQFRLY